ncbi:MAG: hypothetical protein LBP56_01290 [Odoribacteraceae bacterium]|nr:hypothetical protein [Odoribacteraceae bacterium]
MENPFNEQPVKRTTFLTVLCILTFIGSGLGTLSSLNFLLTYNPETMAMQVEEIAALPTKGSPFLKGFLSSSLEILQASVEHGLTMYGLSLLFYLLSVTGAILMFRLRRRGFFLYACAQVALFFVTPYFTSFSSVLLPSFVLSALLVLLFIILYALNLKQMR